MLDEARGLPLLNKEELATLELEAEELATLDNTEELVVLVLHRHW